MSSRAKRKFDIDPNASDPDDYDYDDSERRAAPQRRRNRHTPGAKKKPSKRQRRAYGGSDIDDDDEIESDDSFTERSESEEPEINPATGRSVRRATKKQIKYEESEDEIEDTPSEDDTPKPASRRRAQPSIEQVEKPSLIVKLKMPDHASGRSLRTRTGSKSLARGKTPEVHGTRRSNRLSHDVEEPIVQLTDSGRHVKVVREGTRSPEPVIARATRGGKGPRVQHPSAIMEASQETSMIREDSPGPLDALLTGEETQVKASKDSSPVQEAQQDDAEGEDDDDMEGVIQESQHEEAAEEESDEEGPVTRGGRNTRTRAVSAKRKKGADESSDFEPPADDDKEEEMSESDHEKGKRSASESASGSGRRSTRLRGKKSQSQRSRRNSSSEESGLDQDELQDEIEELEYNKRRRLSRRNPDKDLVYDEAPKRRARNAPDYRVVRPEQNTIFENDDDDGPVMERPRARGGRSTYKSLWRSQGPFGGGVEAGMGAAGGDSDSSEDENQKMPKPVGGMIGMTPTTATAPTFGFPQTNNADPKQDSGGGPANLGKVKDKKALADSDPLGVDPNVNFDGVGGLDDHINKLKEMVMLPLLYPEVFQRFKITPPRGVLFHGPPGTGKTLLARALASSVSTHGQKVTFYMRKGADALSKWVGEAERQLRLLFEEARKTQPSIIFFDEIDGLAPVRSSKQEQIHASIVATLLALMDGMDGRGQVIVIGATNRPDSVDPALRRPGRFDREFYFPLPDVAGRRSIIDIHTKKWEPPLKPEMKDQLAELTKGYGGADIRALCTEAALNAVQGTYPQIYTSEKKLLIDPSTIKILAKDFMISVNKMVPSSQRTVTASAAPLGKNIEPLLRKPLAAILKRIDELIPRRKKLTALEEAEYDDRDDEKGFEREATMRNFESSRIFRPRLLISGLQGMGQQYLGAALLNKIEGLHVQSFDLPTILEDSTRAPEAAITQLFTEVRRHKPSVIYIPSVDVWYQTLPAQAIKTFKLLLRSVGANEPIMLLGVLELLNEKEKPDRQMMMDLFSFSQSNQFQLMRPDQEGRAEFFNNISHYIRMSPADFPDPDNRKKRVLPELEAAPIVAPVIDPKEVAAREKWQKKQDRLTLNKMKIVIQPIMDQLKRSHRKFFKPILEESWYAYLLEEQDSDHVRSDLPPEQQEEQGVIRPWEFSKDSKGVDVLLHVESGNKYYNLDLSTIEKRLSNGYYKRPADYLFDIKTLVKDARTFGDAERTLKGNEMITNVEVDLDNFFMHQNPGLLQECEAVYQRELERERKAQEKRERAIAANKDFEDVARVPPEQSIGTTETSGPITLGEPVPGRLAMPPVTPLRASQAEGLSNGTSGDGTQHATNGSTAPSNDDTHMTDSQDLNVNTHHDFQFQTPSRIEGQGTQTQKSQMSGRTFMAPNSHPNDYHNSASTTTSGQKTSNRSSDNRFGTQSSNGAAPSGIPNFSEMMPEPNGSQLPDTQGSPTPIHQRFQISRFLLSEDTTDHIFNTEVHYVSSQPSNSQPSQTSQSSQHVTSMPAPAPPHHSNLNQILNDEEPKPQLILDDSLVTALHNKLVHSTSGCSLEQLEQINAALMDAIWKHRSDYNRNLVLKEVTEAFNVIIKDIETMQEILKSSQEEEEAELRRQYHSTQDDWFSQTQARR
ncbi:putative AAA domain-containing protein [Alternaria arborescens]|uniref:Putative AAA domain-containing protein n=1 Tax=Alternaria arborescens TaxID=156630 RepID=A0A4Q4RNI8_9PLEO|nr:putative AAA domain-containing protein [Alternaria arborescens]RYN39706.1 putative AAA domain-containing protein [Alternaria arborescens]RYO27570.1 putative AAA domain-containing protein [Alternaria arborescens]RYO58570.1 putative AAA domain-containing protein [Alternaria arborescens]